MIGLLIQDNAYEQDIRELLMSFYPGELYAHELKDDLEFYVETALGDGTISVIIWEKDGEKEAGSDGSGDITWKPVMSRTGTSDLSDHLATKNVVKKMFYQMLVERTKKELPWGSLTGIRPTKIALTRLEEGWREQDIRSFMKETYMASDEKIDLSIEIAAREKKLLEPLHYYRGYSLYVG
ncbi:MAG: coproporphyrinogen dehydrogenase HemZ, partial [Clostridium sp.]|nr:coproporphyrinogen dehydrogenase HemZ [Clostridium sp.]